MIRGLMVLLLLALPAAVGSQQKEPSLADVARKNQQAKNAKPSRTFSDDDLPQKPPARAYPALGIEFAIPDGWPEPDHRDDGYGFLYAHCPGYDAAVHRLQDTCLVTVSVSETARYFGGSISPPEFILEKFRSVEQNWQGTNKQWKRFEKEGYLAGESTAERLAFSEFPRRVRVVYLVPLDGARIYKFVFMSEAALFDKYVSAMDLMIATFAPKPAGTKAK